MTTVKKIIPSSCQSRFATFGDVTIHYLIQGSHQNALFFLHGFPEYSGSWTPYLSSLSDSFTAVAPDLRGYHPSSQPKNVEAYQIVKVAHDIEQLARQLGFKSISLVGHDWGGIVSWYLAALYPGLIKQLIILNAPHPLIYDKLYASDPDQRKMASYIDLLLSPDGEKVIKDQNFKWLRAAFGRSAALQFSDEKWEGYLNSWKNDLSGPLNYYRANIGQEIDYVTELSHIKARTLVLWGEKDPALSLKNLYGIEQYVPHVTVKRFSHASHFINHEMTPLIIDEIRKFCAT